jgi:hypothetical protein
MTDINNPYLHYHIIIDSTFKEQSNQLKNTPYDFKIRLNQFITGKYFKLSYVSISFDEYLINE